ncbi:unnamed protein product [Pylaiella littoralis]
MTPSPDTQDSSSSTTVAMDSPTAPQHEMLATRKGATAAMPMPAVAGETENPYLAGLSKKTRGLKKKMEKIKKTETLSASGKHLNEEQLKLLETKPLLEFALAEHERVRVAMEAVAKEKERQAAEQAKLAPPPPPPRLPPATGLSIPIPNASEPQQPPPPETSLSAPADDPDVSAVEERDNTQRGSDDLLPQEEQPDAKAETAAGEVLVSSESVGVSTDSVTTEEAEVQTDVSGPPPPPGLDPRTVSEAVAVAAALASQEKDRAVQEAEERGAVKGRTEAASGLSKVLRLLHVASRFEAKGERLPTAVDFFSKVLLGKTVPPDEADFDDCLDQSVERATLYLDPSNGSKEVAPGVSYGTLDSIVSALRTQIIDGPAATEGAGTTFNFYGGRNNNRADVMVASREAPPTASPSVDGNGNAASSQPTAVPPSAAVSVLATRGQEKASGYHHLQQQQQQQPPTQSSTPNSNEQQQQQQQPVPTAPAVSIDATVPLHPSPSHVRAEDSDLPSPTPIQLGQQASQMEEGVLPPVTADNNQNRGPQHPSSAQQQRDVLKRERRLKPHSSSRVAPAGYHLPTSVAGNNFIPQQQRQQQHPGLGSPPLRHPQQQLLRSPFPQQPTPPLTPIHVEMGQGLRLSPVAPIPAPCPPAPGLAGPSRGPTNLPNANNGGWGGYAQQQPLQPLQLQQQQQRQHVTQPQHHQHHHQHHQHHQQPYRPPVHPSPSHAARSSIAGRGGGGGGGDQEGGVIAPWTHGSPSLVPYAAAGVANGHQSGMVNRTLLQTGGGAGRTQGELANGFSLTPDQVRSARLAPPAAALSNGTAGPGQQQWVSSEAVALSPSPPTPRAQGAAAATALDLERGMTSPWQGPSDSGVGEAVGIAPPPGIAGVAVGVEAPEMVVAAAVPGGSGGIHAIEERPDVVRQEFSGAAERSQDVHKQQRRLQQQQQQKLRPPTDVMSPAQVAQPVTAEPLSQQLSAPLSSAPVVSTNATSNAEIANGHGAPAPALPTVKVNASAKGGNGKARGSGSRSRGGRKGEARNSEGLSAARIAGKESGGAQQQQQQQQQSKGRSNGKSHQTAPSLKQRWSNGTQVASPKPPALVVETPVSGSWADEIPSPRPRQQQQQQQQQQRSNGSARNRQSSQQQPQQQQQQKQTSFENGQPRANDTTKKVSHGARSGVYAGGGGDSAAPSLEAGMVGDGSQQQVGRGHQRQQQQQPQQPHGYGTATSGVSGRVSNGSGGVGGQQSTGGSRRGGGRGGNTSSNRRRNGGGGGGGNGGRGVSQQQQQGVSQRV